jgi:Holliday junction resolvase
MNRKAKGTRNERRCMRILEKAGYSCTRAAASLGLFDVIAIGKAGVRLVQCKTNRTAPPHEREAIQMFEVPPGVTKELWIFRDYVRTPEILFL